MRSSLALAMLLYGQVCLAEDDVRVHDIDGKPWVCFTEADAKVLLDIRIKFPMMEQKIKLLEESVAIKNKELDKLDEIRLVQDQQLAKLVQRITELQSSIDSRNTWYRSVWFWAVVSAAVGAGTAVAVTYAASS